MSDLRTESVMDPTQRRPRRDLADLGDVAVQPSVERAVAAVGEYLGLDVAYTTEFVDGEQVFRVLDGDSASFGVGEGTAMPLEQTYCQRVLDGRLPNVIPDVRADDRAASMPITDAADVGAFVSVPITFSDGRFYGTLCGASHATQPTLEYRDLQFLNVVARMIADQLEREALHERSRTLELEATAASTLMAALGARDGYTGSHSEAVVGFAVAVAERLGLDGDDLTRVRQAALLHDVGKIAVPDAILNKPGRLTEQEWQVMRLHPLTSERIAREAPGLEALAPVLRGEHERWDGRGYPDGIAGEAIPLVSRIIFVCDAYHAMTSDRPYRRALAPAIAREEIATGAGSQFCPTCAAALLAVLDGE
jgi:hypothetical protein